ncbi:MAG: hypothetical protein U0271_24790 [Polyangiaceae bacterium]
MPSAGIPPSWSSIDGIEADPDSEVGYLVYADWLLSQGDIRGEYILSQLGPTADEDRAWGPLARRRAEISANTNVGTRLGELCAHPSARFLRRLQVITSMPDLAMEALGGASLPMLRSLELTDAQYQDQLRFSVPRSLFARAPRLSKLILQFTDADFTGMSESPLEHLDLPAHMSEFMLDTLFQVSLPKLRKLFVRPPMLTFTPKRSQNLHERLRAHFPNAEIKPR